MVAIKIPALMVESEEARGDGYQGGRGKNNRGYHRDNHQESWGGGYNRGGRRQNNDSNTVKSLLDLLRNKDF